MLYTFMIITIWGKPVWQIERFFTWVSKVIRIYFGFALLRFVIGLKISRHFLNQSEVKPKPIRWRLALHSG